MNKMKKVSLLIVFLALMLNLNTQSAQASVDGGINPNVRMVSAINHNIKRVDFLMSIFEICKMNVSDTTFNSIFSDINVNSKNYAEITYAGKIKLAYGYPDKTFRPDLNIKNDEAISFVSNIIRKNYYNFDALKQYKDAQDVPDWAKYSYIKAHGEGFIKDTQYLNPEDELSKENYIFLINKVKEYVEKNYKEEKIVIPERKNLTLIKEENLNITKESPINKVSLYSECTIINAGNLLPVVFANDFNSRKANVGDRVDFIATKDLRTIEGTLLYPAHTRFIGHVAYKKKSKWLDTPAKALIQIDQIETAPDLDIDYCARTYTKNNKVYLSKYDSKSLKKGKAITNDEFLIKYMKLVYPIVKYKNKANDSIYLLLTGDMIIKKPQYEMEYSEL